MYRHIKNKALVRILRHTNALFAFSLQTQTIKLDNRIVRIINDWPEAIEAINTYF